MTMKIILSAIKYFSYLLIISLFTNFTLSQAQDERHTGLPPLYHLDPTAISYPLFKSRNSDYLITTSFPVWKENSGIFIDSTTFTEVVTPFPGVMAGDAVWFDYDNDSDLDIIISGLTDSKEFLTKIYRNDLGNFTDIEAPLVQLWTERGVAWGDYDNDGDFDLAIEGRVDTTGFNNVTKIYRNDEGNFIDINAPLMGLCGGSVIWADFDNDGLLDLLISGSPDNGSTFYTKIYKNTDNNFVNINAGLPGVWGSSIAAADYDNDGDLDILLTGYGHYSTITRLYRNELQNGNITFIDTYAPLQAVNSSAVAWGDYNNDGYLDIALSGISFGQPVTKIYRNNGGISFIDINAPLKPMAISALAWGDYDNDGDLDLAVSGAEDFWYGTNPTTKIYRNDNGTFVDINANITGTWFGSLMWGDYDGDEKLDLLMTGGTVSRPYFHYLGPYYPVAKIYKNNSQNSNTPPTTPNNLAMTISQGKARLTWNSSTDNQTASNALTYNLRVGKTSGGHEIVSPIANVSTGYRRTPKYGNQIFMKNWAVKNLPPGTYYWSVQAVDNGYAGSAFAAEQSFTVTSSGDIKENLPKEFNLFQNYPNPFNPSTMIEFSLPEDAIVTLKIYNLLGQKVATLLDNEEYAAGEHSIKFYADNLSSGIYFYRIVSNNGKYQDFKKMLLQK